MSTTNETPEIAEHNTLGWALEQLAQYAKIEPNVKKAREIVKASTVKMVAKMTRKTGCLFIDSVTSKLYRLFGKTSLKYSVARATDEATSVELPQED